MKGTPTVSRLRDVVSRATSLALVNAGTAPTTPAPSQPKATAAFVAPSAAPAPWGADDAIRQVVGDHPALDTGDILPTTTARTADTGRSLRSQGVAPATVFPAGARRGGELTFTISDSTASMALEHGEGAHLSTEGAVSLATEHGEPTVVSHVTSRGISQSLAILENAQQRLVFDADLPKGHHWAPTRDGGAELLDPNGLAVAVMTPPWAIDATGRELPTHYVIEDAVVRQVADNASTAALRFAVLKAREAVPSALRSRMPSVKLTPEERTPGAALWAPGGDVVWELIGVPSCVAIAQEVL